LESELGHETNFLKIMEENNGDFYSLQQILTDEKILGEQRQKLIKVVRSEDPKFSGKNDDRYFILRYQKLIYDSKDCHMLTIRDVT
jgi:hypothetical protein